MRGSVEGKGVAADDLKGDLKVATNDKVGLCDGVEAGEEDHRSKNNEDNDDEANPADNFDIPRLFVIVVNFSRIKILYLSFKSSEVYTELPEPIEDGQTGAGESPVNYYLQLVEKGDSCVYHYCDVVNFASPRHEGV